jgi:hypothetical protein
MAGRVGGRMRKGEESNGQRKRKRKRKRKKRK